MRPIAMTAAAIAALMVPRPALADTATDWWEIAGKFNFAQPESGRPSPPGRGAAPRGWETTGKLNFAPQASGMPSPPETQRASARAALAVFEAVNAIDRRYQSYVDFPAAAGPASQDAAAATAAFKVLM